ncbi:hypothetical protein J6590_029362 [Homalodisca vitripennis]|nr:hypothetical protein J6590_029362 [Homalodisca vitripennis]
MLFALFPPPRIFTVTSSNILARANANLETILLQRKQELGKRSYPFFTGAGFLHVASLHENDKNPTVHRASIRSLSATTSLKPLGLEQSSQSSCEEWVLQESDLG